MTSVTIKLKLTPDTTKQGRVIYRITHGGFTRTIVSSVSIYSWEWNEKTNSIIMNNCRTERKNELELATKQIQWDIKSIYQIISHLMIETPTFTVEDIIHHYEKLNQGYSLQAFMHEQIDLLKMHAKYGTAATYSSTLKSFMRFLHFQDIKINRIDPDLIKGYEDYLCETGLTKNTISFYMRVLRAVFNKAVENGLVDQSHPFSDVYTGIAKTQKRAVRIKEIRKLITVDLSHQPSLDFARDIFMFSFYTRGMSFVDIAYLRPENIKGGYLIYNRRKTGHELRIKWESCMEQLVSKYQSQCDYYLLPIIKEKAESRRQYLNSLHWINNHLKMLSSLLNIQPALTMYVARHSWASIAKNSNIPITVISEGMGHSSIQTTQIYLASLNESIIDGANKRIINKVKSIN